jgi:hypothetical protein
LNYPVDPGSEYHTKYICFALSVHWGKDSDEILLDMNFPAINTEPVDTSVTGFTLLRPWLLWQQRPNS